MNRMQAVNMVADALAAHAESTGIGTLMQGLVPDSLPDEDWARLEAAKEIVTLRLLRMGAWSAR